MTRWFTRAGLRERRAVMKRKPRQLPPRDAAEMRRGAAAIAVMGSLLAGGLPVYLGDVIRRMIGQPDDGALLWWPVTITPAAGGIFMVSAVVAVGLGVMAFRRAQFWPLARTPWLALGAASALASFFFGGASVSVFADRVAMRAGGAPARVTRLADAAGVETDCLSISRRGGPHFTTLSYRIVLADGARLDLAEGRWPDDGRGARRWLEQLIRLERGPLGAVEHRGAAGGDLDVSCVRALRRQLTPEEFDGARRILRLSEADSNGPYAEPDVAWRRGAAPARP